MQAKSAENNAAKVRTLLSDCLPLLRAGEPVKLLRRIAQAYPEGPTDPRVAVMQGYAYALTGQISNALAAADLAMRAPLSDLWALDLLGNIYTRCHRPAQAYAAFSRARKVAPERPEVLFNFASAAGFLGLTDEAEQAYDRVIATRPDHMEAFLNRSLLRRQTQASNHAAQLLAALDGDLPWQQEVYLRFALGKELEDLGDYDQAFANIAHGAALRRRHMHYAVSPDIEAMRQIARVHDVGWCASAKTAASGSGPIFVLGMPRSGSTLLERMLGRHEKVQSLGELPYFGQALVGAFRDRMGRMPARKDELIAASADLDPSAIGRAYLTAIEPLRDARPRFSDKLPINFLYAGLIARALPDATLVHIRRQPLDLCFAIFKTLFRDAYPFSYDLAELGTYHRGYQALMGHWRAALGERLVEIDYEDLVASPRETLEDVLARLGLDFQEACLTPERDSTGVMTASASQVRQPIHTASVGSAARYAEHLEPLRAALGE